MANKHNHNGSRWLGVELSPVGHTERIASIAGGFPGIFAVLLISGHYVGVHGAAL